VETVVALGGHGFSVELVHDPTAAPEAVLCRIPEGSSDMTNTSVTLQETGVADSIDVGDRYESARTRMSALDYATRLHEMKAIAGQPAFALSSFHTSTRDGTLVIAGSQLASNAWGAANVIFVVGAQKHLLETSVPSIFAAGDVRSASTKRCAAAVGEGAMAVQFIHAHLAERAPAMSKGVT
jgi:NADPH-dependent glutamate synthase beta subunit-like oxidoreductase